MYFGVFHMYMRSQMHRRVASRDMREASKIYYVPHIHANSRIHVSDALKFGKIL